MRAMDTPGELIKKALQSRKWTQRTLAIICGCTEATVSRILTDQDPISASRALVIAEVLPGLTAESLLRAQVEMDLARARLLYRPRPINPPRTDSQRYTELRALVEAWSEEPCNSTERALLDWRHQ